MGKQHNIPEEHMRNPKYGYVVGGMFLFSKWIRENTEQIDHPYKVGQLVELISRGKIVKQMRDCDGTPLYGVEDLESGEISYGHSGHNLRDLKENKDIFDSKQMACPVCGDDIIVSFTDNVPGERIGSCYMCHYEWVETHQPPPDDKATED